MAENEKLQTFLTFAPPSINKSPPDKWAADQSCHSHKLRCEAAAGRGENEPLGREGEREEPRYLVDVPFLTSQMLHLNASAVFLKVHTLQSQ